MKSDEVFGRMSWQPAVTHNTASRAKHRIIQILEKTRLDSTDAHRRTIGAPVPTFELRMTPKPPASEFRLRPGKPQRCGNG